jgi:hypothetical protein
MRDWPFLLDSTSLLTIIKNLMPFKKNKTKEVNFVASVRLKVLIIWKNEF